MTLNNGSAQDSSTEVPVMSHGGELISTLEYRSPEKEPEVVEQPGGARAASEEEQPDDKQAKDDSTSENQDAQSSDAEKDIIDRFDKHPRFQQLNKQNVALKAELAEIKRSLEALNQPPATPAAEPVGEDSNDQFFEKLNNEPQKLFQEREARLRQEILNELRSQSQAEAAKQQTISDIKAYADKFPAAEDGTGFDQMWQSGELEAFVAQHPSHNFISAHMALTEGNRIKAATEVAVAAATEKLQKQYQAKRGATVLSGGPPPARVISGKSNMDIANTKNHGGLTSVLAARLERMRVDAG